MHCRMFSKILGIYLLDISGTPSMPVVKFKNVFRHIDQGDITEMAT